METVTLVLETELIDNLIRAIRNGGTADDIAEALDRVEEFIVNTSSEGDWNRGTLDWQRRHWTVRIT